MWFWKNDQEYLMWTLINIKSKRWSFLFFIWIDEIYISEHCKLPNWIQSMWLQTSFAIVYNSKRIIWGASNEWALQMASCSVKVSLFILHFLIQVLYKSKQNILHILRYYSLDYWWYIWHWAGLQQGCRCYPRAACIWCDPMACCSSLWQWGMFHIPFIFHPMTSFV